MEAPTSTLRPPPPPPPPPSERRRPAARPRTPMMRAFAVLAVLFAVLTIAWTCFTVVDLLARRTYRTTASYPVVGVLDLQTGDADVTIVPDATARIVVDRTVRRGLVRVADHDVERDGTLVIDDGCHRIFSWSCSMAITIHTPVQLTVQGRLGDGDFHDQGTSGALTLSTGDGDIDLTRVTGAVTLHTGDGDITAHALTSPAVSISSGDGDLSLELANAPQQIRIDTGDGDVDACLPADTPPYLVTTQTGDGQLDNQVPTSPSSDHVLAVSAGDGDIHLRLC
jgi:DUF4097 and DUF4098 domain-containing protein YvlB